MRHLDAYASLTTAVRLLRLACFLRALLSPLDESLALWGEGRRAYILELETALRNTSDQGSGRELARRCPRSCAAGPVEAASAIDSAPTTNRNAHRPLVSQEEDQSNPETNAPPGDGGDESPVQSNPVPDAADPDAHHTEDPAQVTSRPTKLGRRRPRPVSLDPGACSGHVHPAPPERTASESGRGGARRQHGAVGPGAAFPSLEDNLARWGTGWRPPPLRELPRGGEGFFSAWTHLGQPDRFELVKSANR